MHPDELLEQLKASANPRKQKSLDLIHAVCREQHERGSRDFSVATISRIAQERGGPVKSTIHNKTGDDFKGLIKAWADHTGGVTRKVRKVSENPVYAVLDKIPDPAVRAVMGAVLAENKKLRGEVNLLKAKTEVVIDQRTMSTNQSRDTIQILPAFTGLTESETQALQHAISEKFMLDEGWTQDDYGRVLNTKGRAIYKVGYATAIRKIIGIAEGAKPLAPASAVGSIQTVLAK
ncbi:gamma-mobile-trio protein GmtX [Rhodoferax ferrireducens]|uniref:gamma-mobile-trio protein GmtX n=1 Tax=Rhodoferax ferrireducens TaxID=192843 RepID=UPI00298EA179|nr:gamma-mobile-trio protein GmtX [Rhodoferax ferrireducens]WPC68317.1 gamma-mobile-trio protein GmtX [Rhodoferax ferrireducens]